MNDQMLVKLRGIAKDYKRGAETVHVLHALDLDIPKGDFLALMGPSGSGKSTLLNLIGGLDRPTAGTIEIAGQRTDSMSDAELGRWRANHVGFVFQMYNLLPVLSAERNVELPLLLTSLSATERRKRAQAALSLVDCVQAPLTTESFTPTTYCVDVSVLSNAAKYRPLPANTQTLAVSSTAVAGAANTGPSSVSGDPKVSNTSVGCR